MVIFSAIELNDFDKTHIQYWMKLLCFKSATPHDFKANKQLYLQAFMDICKNHRSGVQRFTLKPHDFTELNRLERFQQVLD